MPTLLTEEQQRTLIAICDTLVPAIDPPKGVSETEAYFWRTSASSLHVPEQVLLSLEKLPEEKRHKLVLLLKMLSKSGLAGLLTGSFEAFHKMPLAAREKVLQRWATSSFPELRQGFQAFKRLTHALTYSYVSGNGSNPTWPAIQYDGPWKANGVEVVPLALKPVAAPMTLSCDVVVIGSGAGGGVVAGELAQAGHHVIVLEKGSHPPLKPADTFEYNAFQDLYEQAGMLTTEDMGVTILAGSTLGGGTTVNWSASVDPPASVRHEWEHVYGLDGLTGAGFSSSLLAVRDRLGVGDAEAAHSRQTDALVRGCLALGYSVQKIARNVTACAQDACGWCGFGCPTGGKNSVLKTYLVDASRAGAEIIVDCFVDSVLVKEGRAVGVNGWVKGSDGSHVALKVQARVVISSAGALHTPALLMRSGLANPNIGRHLRLHPTTAARGDYPNKLEMWRGPILTVYSDEFSNQDGEGHGALIEVPAAHSGLWASALPWRSGRQHKQTMLRTANQAGFVVITREIGSGEVTLDPNGQPRLHYELHPIDAKHMLTALVGALRIHAAAGAQEIGIAHTDLPDLDLRKRGKTAFESYLMDVRLASRGVNRLGLFSAHQMGSARMGANETDSALKPYGESWEVRNLFVADASVFPTPSGVNPMITIMALAHRTAKYIRTRL